MKQTDLKMADKITKKAFEVNGNTVTWRTLFYKKKLQLCSYAEYISMQLFSLQSYVPLVMCVVVIFNRLQW